MKETLYSRRSNLVVGFHGCDQSIKEQVFEHLARLAAVADLSEENRIAYDKALDRYRVNQIVEEDERRKNEEMRRKAAEEGMKEGLKEGIREGIKEGMEKGEQKKQIEIARKMREDGISIDTIIKYTGLQRFLPYCLLSHGRTIPGG